MSLEIDKKTCIKNTYLTFGYFLLYNLVDFKNMNENTIVFPNVQHKDGTFSSRPHLQDT